jgi:hypothetical protein
LLKSISRVDSSYRPVVRWVQPNQEEREIE